ncbi:hypothetical protein JCM15519_23190 [Fundidesulfovibrio butyratiphilus]
MTRSKILRALWLFAAALVLTLALGLFEPTAWDSTATWAIEGWKPNMRLNLGFAAGLVFPACVFFQVVRTDKRTSRAALAGLWASGALVALLAWGGPEILAWYLSASAALVAMELGWRLDKTDRGLLRIVEKRRAPSAPTRRSPPPGNALRALAASLLSLPALSVFFNTGEWFVWLVRISSGGALRPWPKAFGLLIGLVCLLDLIMRFASAFGPGKTLVLAGIPLIAWLLLNGALVLCGHETGLKGLAFGMVALLALALVFAFTDDPGKNDQTKSPADKDELTRQ